MTNTLVRLFAGAEDAARALADALAAAMREAHAVRGRVTLVLAGGGTPRPLHEALATTHHNLPWEATHIFFGDERCVPLDSPDSNYRMARETLLDRVPIPPANVHPWATDLPSPEEAADAMHGELATFFDGRLPRFDLIVLGMGADGHTASLFPDSPALKVEDRLAVASEAPDKPRERVTLTLPVINNARAVHFLVSGADKREALQCALGGQQHPRRCPASLVRPSDGTLTWWLDEEVAP